MPASATMKVYCGVVIAILASISTVAAQEWSVANLTTCGLSCLVESIPKANCTFTDSACQCRSKTLPTFTSACLLQNCTMHDQLVVSKVQAATCDLANPNRSTELIIITAVLLACAFVVVILRLISRLWVSSMVGLDDWTIILALLLTIPSAVFTIIMADEGFGQHLWGLADGSLLKILRSLYIAENVYVVTLALTKISVLLLYLRLFPNHSVRYAILATIGMIIISTTIIFFMTIFSCRPVPYFWNRDIRGGKCIDFNKVAYANSAMSIIQDLLIVVLPLPVLAKLNMGRKKKIGVGFMFAVGSFGCVVSMIRLKSLLSFGNSLDPSWDYVDVVIWTIVELAVAMACSCFPALRNLLIHLHPRTFLSTIRHTNDKPASTPMGSNTGGRRANHAQGGFVELQQMNTFQSSKQPEVPRKDLSTGSESDTRAAKGWYWEDASDGI